LAELPVAASESSREIDLALANLATGDYLVELDAAADGSEVRELVGFQVVG
jgi:hypothetical protein